MMDNQFVVTDIILVAVFFSNFVALLVFAFRQKGGKK